MGPLFTDTPTPPVPPGVSRSERLECLPEPDRHGHDDATIPFGDVANHPMQC